MQIEQWRTSVDNRQQLIQVVSVTIVIINQKDIGGRGNRLGGIGVARGVVSEVERGHIVGGRGAILEARRIESEGVSKYVARITLS